MAVRTASAWVSSMAGAAPRSSTEDHRVEPAEAAETHVVPNRPLGRESNSVLFSVIPTISKTKEGGIFPADLLFDLNNSHRTRH